MASFIYKNCKIKEIGCLKFPCSIPIVRFS
jgi:hypothetical protein